MWILSHGASLSLILATIRATVASRTAESKFTHYRKTRFPSSKRIASHMHRRRSWFSPISIQPLYYVPAFLFPFHCILQHLVDSAAHNALHIRVCLLRCSLSLLCYIHTFHRAVRFSLSVLPRCTAAFIQFHDKYHNLFVINYIVCVWFPLVRLRGPSDVSCIRRAPRCLPFSFSPVHSRTHSNCHPLPFRPFTRFSICSSLCFWFIAQYMQILLMGTKMRQFD